MPLPVLALLIMATISLSANGNPANWGERMAVTQLTYFADSSHQLNVTDILDIPEETWTKNKGASLNLGYQTDTIWVRFTIQGGAKQTYRLLDVTYPLLDHINIFEKHPSLGIKEILASGDSLPFTSRPFNHPHFVTQLSIPPNTPLTYFVRIKSNAPVQTEFILWDSNAFQAYYRAESSANFFYLGLIICIAIFNLFIFFYIREWVYFIYSCYAFSFALLITSQNAILFEYVFHNNPQVHNWSQLYLACATVVFTALFNLFFLRLRANQLGAKLLKAFATIPILILIFSPIIGYTQAIQSIVLTALIVIPCCFLIGVIHSKQSLDAPMFVLAWSWLIVGVTVFLLAKIGFIPFNSVTNNGLQIGSALELLTFALALARRIHTEKEIRIKAQEIVIEGSKHSAKLQKDLLYSATHHKITGLPNADFFSRWLEHQLDTHPGGLLVLVQLSKLADIHKTLGLKLAAEALEVFSTRLNAEIQQVPGIKAIEAAENFYAATLDEQTHGFYIHPAKISIFISSMERILNLLDSPIRISTMEIEPFVKVTYVEHTSEDIDATRLLRQGNIALESSHYSQKITSYQKEKDIYSERRLQLMTELRTAITEGALSLEFQPLCQTKDSRVIGAEALIRWPHKEHGLLMPDQFIELAEQTGLIQGLTLWVIRDSLIHLKKWKAIEPDIQVAINISTSNLQDSKFIEMVKFVLFDEPQLANSVIFEITESQMMTDTRYALENLWKLNELGFSIAIDDFGTGYSNLAYLKQLPANELKIDKTFILNLESDQQNQTLVKTAIDMAHNLGMTVVAEGVESQRSQNLLADMGCDLCQGFHISRPVSPEQFSNLLTKPH